MRQKLMNKNTLSVAVVGHANAGKTSLIRTLLRNSEFGEVADQAGTTRHVEGSSVVIDEASNIALFDTPGLEDSMRLFTIFFLLLLTTACSTTYPNKNITNKTFPSVQGESLAKQKMSIPEDFSGEKTLLLIGYKQNSQFDIDRWLIALDMTETKVNVYELPTIQGMFPRMFSTFIDNGMRKGIPKSLWKGVITIYEDGDSVQAFTGNTNPNNARVVLLDEQGKIIYFYDEGFAVEPLNEVIKHLDAKAE